MPFRLIIADDHKMFLDGLLSILQTEESYEVVFSARDGKHLLTFLENNPEAEVDLLISDITMKELDGITLNKKVKEGYPGIKTLIISMHQDAGRIQKLIDNDVDGYLPKDSEKKELLRAIKTILSGEKYFAASVKETYLNSVMHKKSDDSLVELTDREKDVLRLIAQEYTTQEIATKLFLSKHTVESYRKNLLSKLNVRNLAGLTKYAIRQGLVH
ncbi:MAG: response regulator transcription factor [Bacteroidota bacterium]